MANAGRVDRGVANLSIILADMECLPTVREESVFSYSGRAWEGHGMV